jgi:predicted nucleotidyltransferase
MEIKHFTEEHKRIFQSLGVVIVYLFGSQATGTARADSDADFAVVFSDPTLYKKDFMEVYGKIYEVLLQVLPEEYLQRRLAMQAHEFDLVFLQSANPRIQFKAAMEGKILYQASDRAVADFREQAMLRYFDFRNVERVYQDAFLNSHKYETV